MRGVLKNIYNNHHHMTMSTVGDYEGRLCCIIVKNKHGTTKYILCIVKCKNKGKAVIIQLGRNMGEKAKVSLNTHAMSVDEAISNHGVKLDYSIPGCIMNNCNILRDLTQIIYEMKSTIPSADGMVDKPLSATINHLLSILKSMIALPDGMPINQVLEILGPISCTTSGTIITIEMLKKVYTHLRVNGIKILVFVGDGTGFWGYAIGMILNNIASKANEDPFMVVVTDPQHPDDEHYTGLTQGRPLNVVPVIKLTVKGAMKVFSDQHEIVAFLQIRPSPGINMEYENCSKLPKVIVILGELPNVTEDSSTEDSSIKVSALSDFYDKGFNYLQSKYGSPTVIPPPDQSDEDIMKQDPSTIIYRVIIVYSSTTGFWISRPPIYQSAIELQYMIIMKNYFNNLHEKRLPKNITGDPE